MFSAILTVAAIGLLLFIAAAWLSRLPKDLSEPYAKVIADSVTEAGHRLTTMEVRFHRFVLAEFNTHSVFVRNSASSRAIPVKKQMKSVWHDAALPLRWPSEQSGMQGGDSLTPRAVRRAERRWMLLARLSVIFAWMLHKIGVHKSITNRILEPFMWHTVVVTSAHWENFFDQRISPLAQREIYEPAVLMQDALRASTPTLVDNGMAHLPYIDDQTLEEVEARYEDENMDFLIWILRCISAARCARVSYLTQDGVRDIDKDLSLYVRLVDASPKHWSPLAHVATPCVDNVQTVSVLVNAEDPNSYTIPTQHLPKVGQFTGWLSFRHEVEAREKVTTYR